MYEGARKAQMEARLHLATAVGTVVFVVAIIGGVMWCCNSSDSLTRECNEEFYKHQAVGPRCREKADRDLLKQAEEIERRKREKK
jgi:hypothetical protein